MLLALPVIFILGALLAGQLNRAIYRFAYAPRDIGPWSQPAKDAPPRVWLDRVPVIGWLGLRRESELHGGGYWIRPLLIELLVAAGFAALFYAHYEGLLLPTVLLGEAPQIRNVLVCQFIAQAILISLMIVATFIDFDELTIPDMITVPGTLCGLLLLWCLPQAALIVPLEDDAGRQLLSFLNYSSPLPVAEASFGLTGLAAGVSIFSLWCFALLDRRWIMRRGLRKALGYFFHGISRSGSWKTITGIWLIGSLGVVAAWLMGGPRWLALLTALFGLAGGGGIVWAIRLVGKAALRKEAMGFGDVTLMAMIGAFLGWQPAVLAFFFAPFAGVLIAVVQAVIARKGHLPYGPYLCLATLAIMLSWGSLWPEWAIQIFALGPYLTALFFGLLALMYALLLLVRFIKVLVGLEPART